MTWAPCLEGSIEYLTADFSAGLSVYSETNFEPGKFAREVFLYDKASALCSEDFGFERAAAWSKPWNQSFAYQISEHC